MKFLIWFLCILMYSLITVGVRSNGFILGGIPTALLALATFGLARFLCKKWDMHKQIKEAVSRSKQASSNHQEALNDGNSSETPAEQK